MVVERRKNVENVPMEEVDVGFHGHHHHSLDENVPKTENVSQSPPSASKNAIRGLLDPNTYATKKTIAQGLLDVALLTANAAQLKYLLQVGTRHEFYHLMLSLICISIILQILAGAMFLVIGSMDVNDVTQQRVANVLNNIITIFIFVISIINITISAFGMKNSETVAAYMLSNLGK